MSRLRMRSYERGSRVLVTYVGQGTYAADDQSVDWEEFERTIGQGTVPNADSVPPECIKGVGPAEQIGGSIRSERPEHPRAASQLHRTAQPLIYRSI